MWLYGNCNEASLLSACFVAQIRDVVLASPQSLVLLSFHEIAYELFTAAFFPSPHAMSGFLNLSFLFPSTGADPTSNGQDIVRGF